MALNKLRSKEMKSLWRKLERVYFGLDPLIEKKVQANERFIVKMNAAQMYAGKDRNGNDIQPAYKPYTIRMKRLKKQPTDRVTLRDKGNFHFKHLQVFAMYNSFAIDTSLGSQRPYGFLMSEKRYGEDILGLNDKNMEIFFNKKLRKPIEKLFEKLKK